MNFIRVFIFIYLIATPMFFIASLYLSARTRNIIDSNIWLRKYYLTSLVMFALVIINFGILFRLFPTLISHVDVECEGSNYNQPVNILEGYMIQGSAGLLEINELDYISYANAFQPEIVGYANDLYYSYNVINVYMGDLTNEGLLNFSENQPAFLMDDYPCATLSYKERLDPGVYFVFLDDRTSEIPYQDQWYDEAHRVYRFELIEGYDVSLPIVEQSSNVKDQIAQLVGSEEISE